jgi:hypothetical protein
VVAGNITTQPKYGRWAMPYPFSVVYGLCIAMQTEVNNLLLWIAWTVLLYKIYFDEALKLLNQNVAGANEQSIYSQ